MNTYYGGWLHERDAHPRFMIWNHDKTISPTFFEHTASLCDAEGASLGEASVWDARTDRFERLLVVLGDLHEAGGSGFALDSSLQLWTMAAGLVLQLVRNGHYIPAVTRNGAKDILYPSAWAHWNPFWADPTLASERQKLVAYAGHAVLLRTTSEEDVVQVQRVPLDHNRDLEQLVSDFLELVTDGFIKESAESEEPLLQAVMRSINPRYVAPLKPTEHWLHALLQDSRILQNTAALDWISEEDAAWRAELNREAEQTAFSVCMRLEEPAPAANRAQAEFSEAFEQEAWKLSFFVEAAGSPDQPLFAEQIWNEPAHAMTLQGFCIVDAQEVLLRTLGKAGDLFEPIRQSLLEHAAPTSARLTLAEAYAFLQSAGYKLLELGLRIYVPAWWGRRGRRRMGVALHLQSDHGEVYRGGSQASRKTKLNAYMPYRLQLTLDGQPVSRPLLERWSNQKTPLVRLDNGQWLELTSQQAADGIRLLDMPEEGMLTSAEAVQLALGVSEAEEESAGDYPLFGDSRLPLLSVSAEGEFDLLLKQLTDQQPEPMLPQPAALNGTLRNYQRLGYSWLVGRRRMGLGVCLADDMGLGKTIQWISYLLYVIERRESTGPALLICPTSIVGNWQRELSLFAPDMKVWTHYGTDRLHGETFAENIKEYDVVLTTYTTAQRDEEDLEAIVWDCVTLDEAQYIKNSTAKQSQTIRKLKAYHRIALTGTPIENRLTELWSIFDFLNAGYLGAKEQFNDRYAAPIEKLQDRQKLADLHVLVKPFILRRVKSDVRVIQDLPEKQELKVYCQLTKEQIRLYEACVRDAFHQIDRSKGMARRGIILAALTHLKQICNHPAHFLDDGRYSEQRSGKMLRLFELLEDSLVQGESTLIFTQYAKMAVLLQKQLAANFGEKVFMLHGQTPREQRDRMIREFQNEPDAPKLFVLSLKAGGFGLNLTRASQVVHFDRWWNPAVENQATDRVHRIGQQNKVWVHKLICTGTLEERIDELMERKQALASSVIGSGDEWLTELSLDDLKQVLTLRSGMFTDLEDEEHR